MSRLLLLMLGLTFLSMTGKAEQCLVIGDSLTKEYEVEFTALYPQNPASWSARNWIEILHQRRNAWFDLGTFSAFPDTRLTGHAYNWAFPGATTAEIKSNLGTFVTYQLDQQLKNTVERVVIFAGGNDVDSYYGNIYNGIGSAPSVYTNATRDNLKWIVDYVRGKKRTLPIVLVAVPHLGCSPDVQRQYPTDPVKTARVTAALDALNAQLATAAQGFGIGFAPGVYDLTKSMISQPFRIGGIEFYKQADMDARPRYVFSGDGFHPGTSAQAKIAQIVIEAFRTKYPATAITPLGDAEIVAQVLGLDPNIPFAEWLAGFSVPAGQQSMTSDPDGDGVSNLLEFALAGMSPTVARALDLSPRVIGTGANAQLSFSYTPNPLFLEWATLKPQQSSDLVTWTDVTADRITTNANGSVTVTLPASTAARFLRLKALK